MSEALNLLARRRLPDSYMTDEEGALRLVVPRPEVGELLEHLFGELRANAAGDPMVARHLALSLRRMQASSSHTDLQRCRRSRGPPLAGERRDPALRDSDYEALRRASHRVTAWIRLEAEGRPRLVSSSAPAPGARRARYTPSPSGASRTDVPAS